MGFGEWGRTLIVSRERARVLFAVRALRHGSIARRGGRSSVTTRRREGAREQKASECARLWHEGCDLDLLVERVKPFPARTKSIDGGYTKRSRRIGIGCASHERSLLEAEPHGASLLGIRTKQDIAAEGTLERQSIEAAIDTELDAVEARLDAAGHALEGFEGSAYAGVLLSQYAT